VQFKAGIVRADALAQELHDTLEQTLTGIALQLDTASKLFEAKPETANRISNWRGFRRPEPGGCPPIGCGICARGVGTIRSSGALAREQQTTDKWRGPEFEVTTKGRVRPLPDTLEENLLRIAQEAMTNVIKHAQQPQRGSNSIMAQRMWCCASKDNGRGFDRYEARAGGGHLGCWACLKRAKRLGAALDDPERAGAGRWSRFQVGLDRQPQPKKRGAADRDMRRNKRFASSSRTIIYRADRF